MRGGVGSQECARRSPYKKVSRQQRAIDYSIRGDVANDAGSANPTRREPPLFQANRSRRSKTDRPVTTTARR